MDFGVGAALLERTCSGVSLVLFCEPFKITSHHQSHVTECLGHEIAVAALTQKIDMFLILGMRLTCRYTSECLFTFQGVDAPRTQTWPSAADNAGVPGSESLLLGVTHMEDAFVLSGVK